MIRTGILFAVLSAALFGASTPLAKLLLGSVDPWAMARSTSTGIVMTSIISTIMRRAGRPVTRIRIGIGTRACRTGIRTIPIFIIGTDTGILTDVAVATARTVSCGSRPPAPNHQLST
jgi:hypothetical protein